MGSLASLSDIVNRRTGGTGAFESLPFFKADRTQAGAVPAATVQGRLTSLWGYAGVPAGVDVVGSIPGTTPTNPTNSTNGALKQANPGGGRQKYLLGLEAVANQVGSVLLYDRLLQMGGLDGTVTSAQTVGGTLSRYTSGDGNELFLEIYTALGATPTTVTASYTNEAGTSGRTTVAVPIGGTGWNEQHRMIQLPLQAGDKGVRAVASVTLAATTGTAGNFGVTIGHPLCFDSLSQAGAGFARDLVTGLPTLPELLTNAALAMAWLAGSTTFPQIFGALHSVEA